jgi:predicted permease
MRETFEDRLEESRKEGTRAVAEFGLRTAGDLAREGIRERLRPTLIEAKTSGLRNNWMGWGMMMGNLAQDLRFALRSLARRPGFAVVAVMTLALGIGANTAIFSVVNGVLLSSLPYPDPSGLITIDEAPNDPGGRPGSMSAPDIFDIESEAPSLSSLVGVNNPSMTLTGLGDPQVVTVTRLTKGLLATFQLTPRLGRDIRADEFGPDAPSIIVLGYGFWQSRFGGSPDMLGRAVTLNGVDYEVVGVAPEGFAYPSTAELWTPRRMDLEGCGRGCSTMRPAVGRLAAGATVESVQAEVDALALTLESAYPETNTGKRFLVRSLQDRVVGGVARGLWLILGSVGIVLVIACANVANLLLVRAATRTGEVAVRRALGASRGRLITQVMVESGVIAVLGGLSGLALAGLGVQLLPLFSAGGIPRIDEISIDGPVLLFTLGSVVLVTVLFGLAPAFALARTSLRTGIGSGATRGGEGRGSGRARGILLGAEVALSAVLLVGAGLLLRSFSQLYAVDVGFETQEILRFKLNLPRGRYTDLDQITTFYRTLEDRIRTIPGVEAAGSVWGPPLGSGNATGTILVDGPVPNPRRRRKPRPLSIRWGPGGWRPCGSRSSEAEG